jgi:hypothetical protein
VAEGVPQQRPGHEKRDVGLELQGAAELAERRQNGRVRVAAAAQKVHQLQEHHLRETAANDEGCEE